METFLFFYSNPRGTEKLKLDNEVDSIRTYLDQLTNNKVNLVNKGFVKNKDLIFYLERHKPSLVQFSTHATIDSEIVLAGDRGNATPVDPKALERVFATQKDTLKCVLLNCCYSAKQAAMISKHIPFVIGMKGLVDNEVAPLFSSRFVGFLVLGLSVEKSFDLACAEIGLTEISNADIPKLICKKGVNPAQAYLVPKPRIYAEFVMEGDQPRKYEDGDFELYDLKIYIEGAPPDVSEVLYQYMDSYWELTEQVEEIDNSVPFFEDNLGEDGNIEIRATLWSQHGGICVKTMLYDALVARYGKPSNNHIAAAMKEFK